MIPSCQKMSCHHHTTSERNHNKACEMPAKKSAYSQYVQAICSLWRTRNRAVAITTNVPPSTINASEGGVQKKRGHRLPNTNKRRILSTIMRAHAEMRRKSRAGTSPCRIIVGAMLV